MENKLTFCPIGKSAANWISKRMLQLTGEFGSTQLDRLQEPPSVIARHRFPFLSSWEKYSTVLSESTNMIFVRHPFDRLLQYYRDSLENAKKNPNEYLLYGRRIAAKYRKKSGI